jgi:carboxypeptidase Q
VALVEMAFLLILRLVTVLCSIAASSSYTIAPITDAMKSASSKIISYLLPPTGVTESSSEGWSRLAYICDTYGPRFSGSQALEDALGFIRDLARDTDGLRVTEQATMIPKWVRGEEVGYMLSPRRKRLNLVGLGMSNKTIGMVEAEVLVVADNIDLQANCSKATGKIVLFNTLFTTYGETVQTRTNGNDLPHKRS